MDHKSKRQDFFMKRSQILIVVSCRIKATSYAKGKKTLDVPNPVYIGEKRGCRRGLLISYVFFFFFSHIYTALID